MLHDWQNKPIKCLLLLFIVAKCSSANKTNMRRQQQIGGRLSKRSSEECKKMYNGGALAHSTTSHLLLHYVHTEHQTTIKLSFGSRGVCASAVICSKQSKQMSVKVLPSVQFICLRDIHKICCDILAYTHRAYNIQTKKTSSHMHAMD